MTKSLVRGERFRLAELHESDLYLIGILALGGTSQRFDVSCIGLDANDQLSDERYMIFYNQPVSPCGGLKMITGANGEQNTFSLELSKLPSSIRKLVFCATVDGDGTMNSLSNGTLSICSEGTEHAHFRFTGKDFSKERALVVAELYLKNEWRLCAVGQGFNGGLDALIQHFGGTVAHSVSSIVSTPITLITPTPPSAEISAEPFPGQKITLVKTGDEHKVDLTKEPSIVIHCNLNWQPTSNTSFLSRVFRPLVGKADLDLGCMWEVKTGEKGVVQALGEVFGDKTQLPFIQLDKDDRDGQSSSGENLTIFRPLLHNRIVIFAYIYQGQAFASVDTHLRLTMSNGESVEIDLDAPSRNQSFCSAALIEIRDNTVILRKENRYFGGHKQCDQHYKFGFDWSVGSKDS